MIVTVAALLLQAGPASAGRRHSSAALPNTANNCLQDIYGKNVKCTANDVRIASASNIRDLSGSSLDRCNAGEFFSFIADFTVVTTATARENIGLYFATGGQSSALTGSCSDNIISPQHACPLASSVNCGSNHYEEFDDGGVCTTNCSPDNCGDTSSSDPNGGTQIITVEVDNMLCPASGQHVTLPNCTSWQQPGGTLLCSSPAPSYPFQTAATPGSPSKCNCDTLSLNIISQAPSISVTKTPNPSSFTDAGGAVNYSVVITNTSNFGSVTINQLCDDKYGNIVTAAGQACQGGSLCADKTAGTTCASNIQCPIPATLSAPGTQGDSITCTFTGTVPEQTTTDTVTVNGVGVSATASATVTVGEAQAAAADIKTSASAIPSYGCATVRYSVEVDNTSGGTTDETESLSALTDTSFGGITTVHDNVLGTTCGVANGLYGLGTMAQGQTNALVSSTTTLPGTLPATLAPGAGYTCKFDAKVCGNVGALTNPPNATNCPAGIENIDTVSGTLVGDEGETVTQTPASLIADVCFSTSETTAVPTPTPTP